MKTKPDAQPAPDRPARRAVYAGSFDPVTLGHLDVIRRACRLFDHVVVGVAQRPDKHPLFTPAQRVRLIRQSTRDLANLEVETFRGLLVDFVQARQACAVVRGLRAVMDFDYEFQMALTNRKLAAHVETVFFVPSEKYFYLSSSLVRELAAVRGRLSCFVSEPVERALRARFPRGKPA